ncbi:hypothetical protein [Salinimicrobium sp. WS361]|uniref:hypothetical protein n=1 Tax=Salinimicrobium sp. WS361 TaxID=3425123 RepID=UPI003D6DBA71
MNITRTTAPIPWGRDSEMIILAMSINLEWKEDENRWIVSIREYKQVPYQNPEPGTPLYYYPTLLQQNGEKYKKKTRTPEQVNALFTQFNVTIAPGDNFTDKFRHVIALSTIYENQVKPPYAYALNPADLEMVDTTTEVAPEPIIE